MIIPLADKDKFNRTQPADDAKNYGKYVVEPGLAAALNALYPDVKAPENNRTDIVQAVLQGIPGLNAFPGEAGKTADRHAEDQPRRAAGREPEPPRRRWPRTTPATRTAAG